MRDAAGTGSPLTAYMREDSLHSAARIGSRLRDACTDSSAELIGRGRFLAFWCVKSMMSVSSMTAPTLKVIGSTRTASLSVPPQHAGAKCGAGQERRGCQAEQLPLEWLGEVKAPATLASRRPRLFWAVAASAAGTSVAFLNHASQGCTAPRHIWTRHSWPLPFRCPPFDPHYPPPPPTGPQPTRSKEGRTLVGRRHLDKGVLQTPPAHKHTSLLR